MPMSIGNCQCSLLNLFFTFDIVSSEESIDFAALLRSALPSFPFKLSCFRVFSRPVVLVLLLFSSSF
jgi:hypothetical protein